MPNSENSITRRLAAILIADVVGYTRLMERDDTGTFSRLRNIRDEVVDPAIVSHGGRIVKTAGDGLVAEFSSAVAGLRAAIQIQREMAARNAGVALDKRIDYRIGVNLGDIMIDASDIAGDGVNVASRLETMAEPGGICVSGSVREQVHGNLDVEFEDIGEQQVKNIARPIRVCRVLLERDAPRTSVSAASRPPVFHWRRWTAGLAALIAVGIGAWLLPQLLRPTVAPAPPAMSLAILPFAAPSGSPADEQFAAALTQDLTTAMGQWSYTKVAASALVAGYKPGAADIRALGQSLNVRYVVEGEVRRVADEMVVTAHLIDTVTGAQAWSDRLRYASLQPAAGQPVPSVQLTKRLRNGLRAAERRRVMAHPEAKSPMDLVLRGDAVLNEESDAMKAVLEARKLYNEALRLNPDLLPAVVGLSLSYDAELEESATPDRATILPEMDRLSSRAIMLDRTSAWAWVSRMNTLEWLGRWDEAAVAADRVAALDPADINGPAQHAWILLQTGRPAEALPFIAQALAIDPLAPSWPTHFTCKAQLFLGRYDDAVAACEKASAENNEWLNLVYLCAAYAQHGDMAKAVAAKDALLKQKPGYTIAWFRATYQSATPAFFELVERHLAPGLRKAGIPEK